MGNYLSFQIVKSNGISQSLPRYCRYSQVLIHGYKSAQNALPVPAGQVLPVTGYPTRSDLPGPLRIVLELLLPLLLLPPLQRPLLARKQPLQCQVLCVPSVANPDILSSIASSFLSPARRRRRYSNSNHPLIRKIGALIAKARLMRLKKPRLLLSLQEQQVFVYPCLPAPCLMPGTQTQGPLLI